MAIEDILKNLSLGTPGPTRRGRLSTTTTKPYARPLSAMVSRLDGVSGWPVAAVEAGNELGRKCRNVGRRRGGPPTHLERTVSVAVEAAPVVVEPAVQAAAEVFAKLRLKAPATRVGRKTTIKAPYARPAAKVESSSSLSRNVARRNSGPPTNMELKAAVAVVSRIFGHLN